MAGDTRTASNLTSHWVAAPLNHSHYIKATHHGNYNSKASLPPCCRTLRWIMDAHCWAWEVRCVKAVIADSHPLMPIVNTLRQGGWNFGFLATHEHKQHIALLYTLQEINTQRELSMCKSIIQDMNSKIIIFELHSLVLTWDIILSFFFYVLSTGSWRTKFQAQEIIYQKIWDIQPVFNSNQKLFFLQILP